MGTTVTPNLSLIRPDSNEPIPNWPAQNGSNMDTLDALFKSSQGVWIPTFTGDTTNPTIGSGGFIEGRWLRLWPKMIFAHMRINMGGAGFLAGSGRYRFTLPFTPSIEMQVFNQEYPIGKAIVTSAASVANSAVMEALYDISTTTMVFRSSGGNYMQSTIPFTWAQNDKLSCHLMFPTASP